MPLTSLVYISVADHQMEPDELLTILDSANRNNPEHGLTGMLLYQNGFFIQVLEGEASDVDLMYERILNDDRHHHIVLVEKVEISERAFGNWTMGFKNLDEISLDEVDGLTEFLQQPMTQEIMRDNPSHAVQLLYRFKEEYGW